jgi:hypothetical protein
METIKTKMIGGKYKIPVTLILDDDRIYFKFGFNRKLMEEVKTMHGARWHGFEDPPKKMWSVTDCQRNWFQIEFLEGKNPYAPYDADLMDVEFSRSLFDHQKHLALHALSYKHVIWAAEMGTGKSLAAIEVIERSGHMDNAWYVGPKSGVRAFGRELSKWGSPASPNMMTYEGLVRKLRDWGNDIPAPRVLILDESSKVKTHTSQRSLACQHVANSMREEYGRDCYIVLMSGTPAPKTPLDWWMQCEIACPGFVKEGTVGKFRVRLAITEQRETITGGVYPHHIGWKDQEGKCAICGGMREADGHDKEFAASMGVPYHEYEPSANEVEKLYRRMAGLVLVKFKKDCLDLPDKTYEEVRIKPSVEILRTAKMIKKTSARAIEALTLMRELSDGFQYIEVPDGKKECPLCHGNKKVAVPEPDTPCPNCNATGEVTNFRRDMQFIGTPKDEQLITDLDAHEDVGRIIIWGGFSGTVDRVVDICQSQGWGVLRVDGRGYHGFDKDGETLDADELLSAMDASHPDKKMLAEKYERVAFVGNPKAGGMALTLTASPTEIFFSNDFSGEARSQAEDRFHRAGMDENRGATIVDYIHLPTDQLVLQNLKAKRKLETMTMGDLDAALKAGGVSDD